MTKVDTGIPPATASAGQPTIRDSSIIMYTTGVYVACLVIANATAGKLFHFFGASISAGAFAYMCCLAASDVLVDLYGRRMGFRLIIIGTAANIISLAFSQLAVRLPPALGQEWLQPHFAAVFASSASVIVASVIGYPITELFETVLWTSLKERLGKKRLWIRNALVKGTGQFIDATVFFTLAFFLVPMLLYGDPLVPEARFWSVMTGAWIYGLWKGVLIGNVLFPVLRLVLPFLRARRVADIPELAEAARREDW